MVYVGANSVGQSIERKNGVESDRSVPPLWRRFEAEFLRKYRGAILLGLLGLLVESVLLLPIPLLQGWVVDQLVAHERARQTQREAASPDRVADPARVAVARAIGLTLAGTIALYLTRSLLAWRTAAMMGRISQEVVVALRGALHRKLMWLPMAYFDAQQTGRIMARVTSDVGSILMFIRGGIIQLLNDLVLSMAIAILLGWLQWRLALVALVDGAPLCPQSAPTFSAPSVGCPTRFARKSRRCTPF